MTTRAGQKSGQQVSAKKIRHDDWSALTHGHIELRYRGSPVTRGYVELAMPDGSALWLREDATLERRYYARAEGYSAWISPRDLQPAH